MAELRAGGLALVYGLKIDKRHNGKSAKLLETDNFKGNKVWICEGDFEKSGDIGVFYPQNLMPIDGDDFSHEKESEKQLQNA